MARKPISKEDVDKKLVELAVKLDHAEAELSRERAKLASLEEVSALRDAKLAEIELAWNDPKLCYARAIIELEEQARRGRRG